MRQLDHSNPAHVGGEAGYYEYRASLTEQAAEKLHMYHRLLGAWAVVLRMEKVDEGMEGLEEFRALHDGNEVMMRKTVEDLVMLADREERVAGDRRLAIGAGLAVAVMMVCNCMGNSMALFGILAAGVAWYQGWGLGAGRHLDRMTDNE